MPAMRTRRWITTLLLAACLAPQGLAQDPPREPVAVLEWPDGRRQARRIVEVDLAAIAAEEASFLRLEGLEEPPVAGILARLGLEVTARPAEAAVQGCPSAVATPFLFSALARSSLV